MRLSDVRTPLRPLPPSQVLCKHFEQTDNP